MSLNITVLVGNLTRDIELKTLPSGTIVGNTALAVNERVKRNGEWVEEATFIDLKLWGKTAENTAKFVKKGERIGITGRLQQERWEKDGEKRSKHVINVNEVQFLNNKRVTEAESDGGPDQEPAPF